MAIKVAGELYESITGQLFEIGRQLRQSNGYPFEPAELKNFLQLAVEGKFNGISAPTVKPKTQLLELVTQVATSAVDKFVAGGCFKVDTGKKAAVKIAFVWDNFAEYFIPKVEEDIEAGGLKVYKLLKSSFDAPIIAELGDGHETKLADLWAMLRAQPGGEKGTLLTNGCANIFYIRDKDGTLWAVDARWISGHGGWGLDARSVEDPYRWNDGRQVVSR